MLLRGLLHELVHELDSKRQVWLGVDKIEEASNDALIARGDAPSWTFSARLEPLLRGVVDRTANARQLKDALGVVALLQCDAIVALVHLDAQVEAAEVAHVE